MIWLVACPSGMMNIGTGRRARPIQMGATIVEDRRKDLVAPLLILAFGVGWLLNGLGLFPSVDWAWSIGLAACGVLILIVRGLNKATVVLGPFFLVAAVLSVARQQFGMPAKIEMPCLVITLGVLMSLSAVSTLPPGGKQP